MRTSLLEKSTGASATQGVYIAPDPGVVLKTYLPNKNKLFINICSHEKISPPVPLSPSELVAAGIDTSSPDAEVPMRYPLSSSGEDRSAVDKSGSPCRVWDVVLNPLALAEAEVSLDKKWFLAQLVVQTYEAKFGAGIDVDGLQPGDVKFLAKRKYWDLPVRPQYIADVGAKKRSGSKIVTSQVQADEAATGEALITEIAGKKSTPRTKSRGGQSGGEGKTPWAPVMDVLPALGKEGVPGKIVVTLDMTRAARPVRSARDVGVVLDVGSSTLVLTPHPDLGLADASIDLPFVVDGARVFAQYTRATNAITIRVPILGRFPSI